MNKQAIQLLSKGGSLMIDNYIEKDLLVKSELLKKMYYQEPLIISQLSQQFAISTITCTNYIESLCIPYQEWIIKKYYHHGTYKFHLNQHKPLYQYQQLLMQQSHFLNGCLFYLQRKEHYLHFVEELFISVGTAYQLKAQVALFFEKLFIVPNNPTELEERLLILKLSLKTTPCFPISKNLVFQKHINCFFTFIRQEGLLLSNESRYYVALAFLVAYQRRDKQIHFTDTQKAILEQLPIYPLIKKFYLERSLSNYLNQTDLLFLVTILNAVPYTFTDVKLFQKHYQQLNQLLYQPLNLNQLLYQFEQAFNSEVPDNVFFVNALIKLLKTTTQNMQPLFPDMTIYLSENEQQIYSLVHQILVKHFKAQELNLRFNKSFIQRFTREVNFLLDDKTIVIHLFFVIANKLYLPLMESILDQIKTSYLNIPVMVYTSYDELLQQPLQTLKQSLIFYDDKLEPPKNIAKMTIPINIQKICERFS